MVCMLTVLSIISAFQPATNTWVDVRVNTSQRMVVPQEEKSVITEKYLSPHLKKVTSSSIMCGEYVKGTTAGNLELKAI